MNCLACGIEPALTLHVACRRCRALAAARGFNAGIASPETRLWGRLRIEGECWEYEGARDRAGYGVNISVHGRPVRPYVYALILTQGQGQPGYEADHTCFNRACANPAHLRWLPKHENVRHRKLGVLTREQKRERWAAYQRAYNARQRELGKVRTSTGKWV